MSEPKPRVSVVMPVRNGGEYLHAAVVSILEQDFEDFEFIIVNDHSSDDSLRQIPSDRRIRLINNRGTGIVDALNTGLENAAGEFIARMDADDIALPKRLAVQVDYLQKNPGVGIAGACVELISDTSVTEGYRRYQQWINALTEPDDIGNNIFVESPLPHPSVMMRKSVVDVLGGYCHTPWAEDYDLWLRAHIAGIAMGKPSGVLLLWRDHCNRLSRLDPRCASEKFIAAKAWGLSQSLLSDRSAVICGTGKQAVTLHDCLRSQHVDIRSFVDISPSRIGGKKRGLPVWSLAQLKEQHSDELLLGVVGAWNARDTLRKALLRIGYREGEQFLMAA